MQRNGVGMPHPYPPEAMRGCLPGHVHQKSLSEVPSLSCVKPAPCPRSSFFGRHFPRHASKPSAAFLAFSLCFSPSFHPALATTRSVSPTSPCFKHCCMLALAQRCMKELAFETNMGHVSSSSLSRADKTLCTRRPGVPALIQPCQLWSQCVQAHQQRFPCYSHTSPARGIHQQGFTRLAVHPGQVTPGSLCSHQRAFTPLGQPS